MSDNSRNFPPPSRNYRKGQRLQANDLNKIVQFLNMVDRRKIGGAIDGASWYRCRSEVDADPFSILGIKDVEIDLDGITIVVEEVLSSHENVVANEEYPLTANTPGWVKIINDYDMCLVNVYEPSLNPITYKDDLSVYTKSVVLPSYSSSGTGTGTGTGSTGTGGITPSCDLWAMSPPDDEGRCYVQAGNNPRPELFQSAGGPGNDEIYGPWTTSGWFHKADRTTRVVDYSRIYYMDMRDAEMIVFPYQGAPGGTGELGPLQTVQATFYDGAYYPISGGTKHFFGTCGAASGSFYNVTPNSVVFGSVPAKLARPMFGESYLDGSGVLCVLIGATVYIIASDCAFTVFSSGSGT